MISDNYNGLIKKFEDVPKTKAHGNMTSNNHMTFWQNMSYASYAYVFSVYEHQYLEHITEEKPMQLNSQRTLAMSNRWSDSIIPGTKPHHDTI